MDNNIPVNNTEEILTEEVLTADTVLTEGNLSEPVLTEASPLTSPDTQPQQPQNQGYVPPVVELPTLEQSAAPNYQQPQVVYVQQPVYQQNPAQPVYSQQPIYVQQPVYVQQQPVQKGKGASIAALVLGIVSVASCCFIVFGFISVLCAVLGIIFAIVAFAKRNNGAKTITGLVLSIIGLLIGSILSFACINVYQESLDDYYGYYNDYSYDYEDYDYYA